ncbi:hypothetical protein [Acidovorax sp.]|uniref:hypothetical protein n=1 Tax=Acidovorax sp. TaxID=1872122 RepID=UPI002627A317|nr:hypothetical protein [Acidovorax sp.]
MIKIRSFLVMALTAMTTLTASAGPDADSLGHCLTDNTSGKDRKALARWMFVGISTHAEIKNLSSATPEDLDQSSKVVGVLVTKLLSESCPSEARRAIQTEGAQSMQAAFDILGRGAMQELMADPNVARAMSSFERHIDRKKVESALAAR